MKPPRSLTYANVVSTLALVVAMGVGTGVGASYAASKLPKNSVSAKQIKNNAVRSAEIKDGSVTSADVADGSVTSPDIADGSLTGGDVADGALTAADLDAPSIAELKAPRAYGVVTAAGVLLPGQSRNATVTKVPGASGDYCVMPGPGTGITNKNSIIMLTPDYLDGDYVMHTAMTYDVVSQSVDCRAGFEVQTASYNPNTGIGYPSDVAFTFVIH
jgi:hypothetical protein